MVIKLPPLCSLSAHSPLTPTHLCSLRPRRHPPLRSHPALNSRRWCLLWMLGGTNMTGVLGSLSCGRCGLCCLPTSPFDWEAVVGRSCPACYYTPAPPLFLPFSLPFSPLTSAGFNSAFPRLAALPTLFRDLFAIFYLPSILR